MKKNKIHIDEHTISYTITKSNRKTIGISIRLKDGVRILAPHFATKKQIEEVVRKNSQWIIKKLQEVEATAKNELIYKDGELFPYLGEKYRLNIIKNIGGKKNLIEISEDKILLKLIGENDEEANIKQVITRWYREEADSLLKERLDRLSKETNLYPVSVRIKEQKSRFGSCSSKKNINLNWKLIMAPIEIIDYVVVHELCHLKEMNHSKNFWSLVGYYIPDYNKLRKWLKENGGFIKLV